MTKLDKQTVLEADIEQVKKSPDVLICLFSNAKTNLFIHKRIRSFGFSSKRGQLAMCFVDVDIELLMHAKKIVITTVFKHSFGF